MQARPVARRRAIAPVILSLLLAGCGSAGPTESPPRLDPRPSRVAIEPGDVEVLVGASVTLVALVEDQYGEPIPDAAVTWETLDDGVVTVTAGVVQGSAAGSARVVARAGERADTAVVRVRAPLVQRTRTLQPELASTLRRDPDGSVWELPEVLLVGDVEENETSPFPLQGLIAYPLGALSPDAVIERAELVLRTSELGVFGQPFTLGALYVEHAGDASFNPDAPGAASVHLGTARADEIRADVTALVRQAHAAGASVALLRLRFATALNANGVDDLLEPIAGSLTVTALEP